MTTVQHRRAFLAGSASVAVAGGACAAPADPFAASPWRRISDAEWKRRLPPPAFDVLRRDGTEQPGTSPLLNEHRRGTFLCLACGLALFRSQWKFDSHTGWPSFWTAIKPNIRTKADRQLVLEVRTEYHCAQCLGHQGHIFNDGPKPTGLRYCNDGVSLKFAPA